MRVFPVDLNVSDEAKYMSPLVFFTETILPVSKKTQKTPKKTLRKCTRSQVQKAIWGRGIVAFPPGSYLSGSILLLRNDLFLCVIAVEQAKPSM